MFFAMKRGAARRSAGFTLLELLVVIVIIGLLAAYVGPKYFSQLGKSEVTAAKAQIDAFDKTLDTYRLDVGRYPTTEEGLAALMTAPPSAGVKWNREVKADSNLGAKAGKSDYEVLAMEKVNDVECVKVKMHYEESEGATKLVTVTVNAHLGLPGPACRGRRQGERTGRGPGGHRRPADRPAWRRR